MRLVDFINAGGSISWILVIMNIFGLSLILWRFLALRGFKQKVSVEAKNLVNELSAQLKGQSLISHFDLVKDAITRKVHGLEVGMNTIKVVATTAPLLGLLGTVMGIYEAFQVISSKGLNDPGQFAEGISYALITTIVGLIVAIPHYVAHNYLSGQLDALELQMEHETGPYLKGE